MLTVRRVVVRLSELEHGLKRKKKKSSIINYHVEREHPVLKAHNVYRLSLLGSRVLKCHQNGQSLHRRISTAAATGHGEVSVDLQVWTSLLYL